MTWGQKVATVIVINPDESATEEELRSFMSEQMASYKTPSVYRFVPSITRNLMGKVNKVHLIQEVFGIYSKDEEQKESGSSVRIK